MTYEQLVDLPVGTRVQLDADRVRPDPVHLGAVARNEKGTYIHWDDGFQSWSLSGWSIELAARLTVPDQEPQVVDE